MVWLKEGGANTKSPRNPDKALVARQPLMLSPRKRPSTQETWAGQRRQAQTMGGHGRRAIDAPVPGMWRRGCGAVDTGPSTGTLV